MGFADKIGASVPKISAVIPTYNRSQVLKRAIESVIAQTRPVDEIVVVDDGSTDETASTVAAFGDQVRYIHQHNQGISGARNTAIRAASGDWIALLDDDDEWLPEKVRKQEEAIASCPDAVLVYSNYWSL